MILTCPSCATSYFTPDEAIGPNGRRVRCQSCAHVWTAMLDEPLELTAPTPSVAPAAAPEPAATGFGKREDTPESLAETPAPELPKAFRAKQEQQRRLRRAAAHGAVWAGLASVFVGLLAAAWLFRVEMVELWPRSAAAYAAVGMPVNVTGLEFEAVGARALPDTPDKVMVSGALRNIRDREIVAPAIRVALLDDHGAEIAHAVVRTDGAPVLPGQLSGFAVILADPGGKATGVGVDFVLDAPPAPVPVQRAPARKQVPTESPAPEDHEAETLAQPDTEAVELASAEPPGLRPARALSSDTPQELTPVAAVPLDSAAH